MKKNFLILLLLVLTLSMTGCTAEHNDKIEMKFYFNILENIIGQFCSFVNYFFKKSQKSQPIINSWQKQLQMSKKTIFILTF